MESSRKQPVQDEKDIDSIIEKINSKTPLYKALRVSIDASVTEFNKAYRAFSKKIHPDKGGDEKTFKIVDGTYRKYLSYVEQNKDRTYRDFYRDKEAPEKGIVTKDDSPVFDYASVDLRSHEEIFLEQYNQTHNAPMPPSLPLIIKDIEDFGLSDQGNQFRFGGLISSHKIQNKNGQEIKVSATCKMIHDCAVKALSTGRNVKETLEEILRILNISKQKKQGFFGKRSPNTRWLHDDIENKAKRMLACIEANQKDFKKKSPGK